VKGKLKFIIPIALLIVLFGAYKMVLAKPPEEHHKVEGTVYVLPKEFLINLSDGHFAKLSVALVLPHGQEPVEGGGHGGTPPEGYGALEQEAAVRAVVTDNVTDAQSTDLTNRRRRTRLRKRLLKAIKAETDVKPTAVLFTDVAVQ